MKNLPIIGKLHINQHIYSGCRQIFSVEFDRGYYCQNCEFNINKPKY